MGKKEVLPPLKLKRAAWMLRLGIPLSTVAAAFNVTLYGLRRELNFVPRLTPEELGDVDTLNRALSLGRDMIDAELDKDTQAQTQTQTQTPNDFNSLTELVSEVV